MLFKSINHVAIIVSDLSISKDFYINKLGFRLLAEIERPERQSTIIYLDAGNGIIELFSFPQPPGRPAWPEACGLRHIAFSTDDFEGTIKKLNDFGIETEAVRTDVRTAKRMTFFHDPDDLPVEICET
jgi:glyoxylase I family protein